MSAEKTIFIKGCLDKRREEYKAATATIKPGHLVELNSSTKAQLNSQAGADCEMLVALEDAFQGKNIDQAFAADDPMQLHIAQRGDVLQFRLAANAIAVTEGDKLGSAGDGTVRKTGGSAALQLYSQVAESAEHENTTDAADFDKSYTIPANFLQAGDVIHVRAQATVIDNNSTDTLTLLLTLGGETLATTGAVDVADGDVGYFDAQITIRTIGATGSIQAAGVQALGVPGTVTAKPFLKNDATVATTTALKIAINADWSVAHADNEVSLSLLNVTLYRNGGKPIVVALEDVDNSGGATDARIKCRVM